MERYLIYINSVTVVHRLESKLLGYQLLVNMYSAYVLFVLQNLNLYKKYVDIVCCIVFTCYTIISSYKWFDVKTVL